MFDILYANGKRLRLDWGDDDCLVLKISRGSTEIVFSVFLENEFWWVERENGHHFLNSFKLRVLSKCFLIKRSG
jgi:hypothetical protein